mmetsp:Transcript_1648/g.5004  ORF Transcript_1648/g.5004 Transcript_1648/m.5004 type:complete len:86 (-) Transcript_1648:149-406(-)
MRRKGGFSSPLGVVVGSSMSGRSVQVGMSGAIEAFEGLQVGCRYFVDPEGKMVCLSSMTEKEALIAGFRLLGWAMSSSTILLHAV